MKGYKYNGSIREPGKRKGKCKNCGMIVKIRKSYITPNGLNIAERCKHCDKKG